MYEYRWTRIADRAYVDLSWSYLITGKTVLG